MNLLNGSTPVMTNNYTYDVQNRLASVGNGTHAAHYSRLDGSGLLSNTAIKTSGGTTLLSTDRAYDAYYRMTSIASTAGATSRSYAYTYNDKDQRIKEDINKVGLASNASPRQVASWEYGYDDKGQVVSAVAKDSDGLEIPGYGFGYDYDGIGNRKYEKRGIEAMLLNYISNSVNQYTEVVTPGVVPVVGEADETAAVKALRTDEVPVTSGKQSITATRNGKYFSGAFTGIDNTLSAININYNVYAIIDDTANDKQLVRREPRQYQVPKAVQPLTYDLDGNMTSDGKWINTWNAENRLIAQNPVNTVAGSKSFNYYYDYMGRRIKIEEYTYNGTDFALSNTKKFVYDGYCQIAEFNSSDVLKKSYLRNGSELYSVTDIDVNDTYFYMLDGNKNVMALVDSAGTVKADYTYSPFGDIEYQTGDYANTNPWRFSSEYYDRFTKNLYYIKRYLKTSLGMWMSQDPIQEAGGVNLYGFVKNDPVNKTDYFGMAYLSFTTGKTPPPKLFTVDNSKYNTDKSLSLADLHSIAIKALLTEAGGEFLYPDASKILGYYLNQVRNTGQPYTIDYKKMLNETQQSKGFLRIMLVSAMKYAEKKSKNTFHLAEMFVSPKEYTKPFENLNKNWFYTVGKYRLWAKGDFIATSGKCFEMNIDINLRDTYDWNLKSNKKGGLVRDHEMALLHYNGFAKYFDVNGKINLKVNWLKGVIPTQNDIEKLVKKQEGNYFK